MAPERFGGGYDAISSMERSIHVRETTHVIQIYYVKNVNFHGGEGGCILPPSPPGATHEFNQGKYLLKYCTYLQ